MGEEKRGEPDFRTTSTQEILSSYIQRPNSRIFYNLFSRIKSRLRATPTQLLPKTSSTLVEQARRISSKKI